MLSPTSRSLMLRTASSMRLGGGNAVRFQSGTSVEFKPNEELTFAWITPNALAKSLEGSILARVLAIPGLQLVGARMMLPSDDMVNEYKEILDANATKADFKSAMSNFLDTELRSEKSQERGYPNRMMLMLFKGEDARAKLVDVVGGHVPSSASMGHTIRGAFGNYETNTESGDIVRFQPAAIAPLTSNCNVEYLKLFAKYAQEDGGVMPSWWQKFDGDTDGDGIVSEHETGLVMIKPDNLERPSSLPGHIIDMITTTGLHLKGCKVFSMTPAMGDEFYGFLEQIFVKKLKGKVEKKLRTALSPEYMGFEIDDDQFAAMADVLAASNAKNEVAEIMTYMTGVDPRVHTNMSEEERNQPGPARCFGLLYSGERAIELIRAKLGNTNPEEAEVGSVRSDYGKDVMRNGAHASDAVDRAMVERRIVGMVGDEPSEEVAIIKRYLDTVA